MATANRAVTPDSEAVVKHLRKTYPTAEAYQYTRYCIRVRIIDKRFRGLNKVKRFDLVNPLIAELPDEVQQDIVMLVLLAPGEEGESPANFEYEHPSSLDLDD